MVAGVRRVVTDGARAVEDGPTNRILGPSVQTGNVVDDELARVEDRLAARNRLAMWRAGVHPSAEERKDERIELLRSRGAGGRHQRQHAERIVDADAERLPCERTRAAARDTVVEAAGRTIDGLRREQPQFEID